MSIQRDSLPGTQLAERSDENAIGESRTGNRSLDLPPLEQRSRSDPAVVRMLQGVLAELSYPAQHWQIVTVADSYGVDRVTLARLNRLPLASYPSIQHIAHAYAYPPASGPRRT